MADIVKRQKEKEVAVYEEYTIYAGFNAMPSVGGPDYKQVRGTPDDYVPFMDSLVCNFVVQNISDPGSLNLSLIHI